MEKLNKIKEIADKLGLQSLSDRVSSLIARKLQNNQEIIIPLVGEFSSGKTTLLNSLTDSKSLETASKPTTAIIFELRFGSEKNVAKVTNYSGEKYLVDDFAELKNDKLKEAELVQVFDVSNSVPISTVLVDTPGLSSPTKEHIEALTDYLPNADAIALVSDVNQQLTKSLLNFIKTVNISKKEMFLVLTKCGTKTKEEVEQARQYAEKLLPNMPVICTDALSQDNLEFTSLLSVVQDKKNEIISKAIDININAIIQELKSNIVELLESSETGTDDINNQIQKYDDRLSGFNREIDSVIKKITLEVDDTKQDVNSLFYETVQSRLLSLASGNSDNPDVAVQNEICSISNTILDKFRRDIFRISSARISKSTEEIANVSSSVLSDLDLSNLDFDSYNYSINLSEAGHQYDGTLTFISKGIMAVGAAAAIVVTAGGAIAGTAATGTAMNVGTAVSVADTASDVASIQSNRRLRKMLTKESVNKFVDSVPKNFDKIEERENNFQKQIGAKQTFVRTGVSWITDRLMGKPERKRLINAYIYDTLIPEFERHIETVSSYVVFNISDILKTKLKDNFDRFQEKLSELKSSKEESLDLYNKKIEELNDYLKYLNQ